MTTLQPVLVIKGAWAVTKKKFSFLVGLTLGLVILQFLSGFLGGSLEKNSPILFALFQIVITVLSIIVTMGVQWIALKLLRDEPVILGNLLDPMGLFWRYLGASIVYGFVVFVGLILLIVPGIVWGLKYRLVWYLVLDKKLPVFEAFKESGVMTYGYKKDIFLVGILLGLINLCGVLLFGIGLLVTIPLSWIATALVYKTILEAHSSTSSSQPVVPVTPAGL